MKGVILAGGFATRLRPLSCSKPKLLFPLVGTPLLDYMIEWLRQAKVEKLVLAVNHLSDKLATEVASRNLGSKIVLSIEPSPLGTGGPLRYADSILAGKEPVVVVNGDVACDIDVSEMLRMHRQSDAEATVAVYSVRDTRPFGLITLDSNDRVIKFEEKSSKSSSPGWINAGVYVLNNSAISMIPKGRAVSIEREIFPVLAEKGRLAGWRHTGFWYDIGKIRDYVTANMELLKRSIDLGIANRNPARAGALKQPSFVTDDCIVEKGATVGPNTILSPRVKVNADAKVEGSIVFEDCILGESCEVRDAVIGESSTIGKRVTIGEGSVVAGEVSVPDGTTVQPGSVLLN